MMNILNDIKMLKDQDVSDRETIELIMLKGGKEQEIIEKLNDFYTNNHATQVAAQIEKKNLPLLQIIILILLFIIATVLGIFILQG